MNCENCGQSLGLATTRKKYCSSACKQQAYRNAPTGQPVTVTRALSGLLRAPMLV
jgi:hypothetical protein